MERLMPYAYWPWSEPWPLPRKTANPRKKALLISSSAAPAWLGRWIFGSHRQLAQTARVIGAEPVGRLFTGGAARRADQQLPPAYKRRVRRLARRLLDA